MAKIIPVANRLLPPPSVYKHHRDSRKWLLYFFKSNSCAYCWVSYESTDIDHYVPQTLDPKLILDPFNHLLSCKNCNRFLKRDYHPMHTKRKFHKDEKSGAYIYDIRRSDLNNFFRVDPLGNVVVVHPTKRNERWAKWNLAFFALNKRDELVRKRLAILKAINSIQEIKSNWNTLIKNQEPLIKKYILNQFISSKRLLINNKLFLEIFNLKL